MANKYFPSFGFWLCCKSRSRPHLLLRKLRRSLNLRRAKNQMTKSSWSLVRVTPAQGSHGAQRSEPRGMRRRQDPHLQILFLFSYILSNLVVAQTDCGQEIERRRPGKEEVYKSIDCPTYEGINTELLPQAVPIPDRWRIVDSLGYAAKWYDPYNGNNILKSDKPVFADWFYNFSIISDTVLEPRRFPTPVGTAATDRSGSLDLIGRGHQFLFNQNIIIEQVVYKGDTVFRPPDYEFRFIPVINYNETHVNEFGVLHVSPADGDTRYDKHIGIQGLFIDKHIHNVSDRFDFDSFRIGIQPFSTDFRGFLFQDQQLGIRLFGTRDNNRYQYNLAWFRKLEKDTNSGLNDVSESLRRDDIFIANLYKQDFPVLGFTSQITGVYNRNRERDEVFYDENGFLARPASLGTERGRDYDVNYYGYNGDGHFGRFNLTASTYYAYGEERNGNFVDFKTGIRAFFAAAEGSMDFDWTRVRLSLLHASGDDDPFDEYAKGFDAIFENPQFAGADTSFWIRQAVPLIGGGRVTLSGRNSVLNSLRSSKELGQSNFTNPGMNLAGIGTDFDLTPTLRLSLNANDLWFDTTEVLEALRQQAPIDNHIGLDLSAALIYRPTAIQNIVFRLSGAVLEPAQGFEDLFGDRSAHSILGNFIFTY